MTRSIKPVTKLALCAIAAVALLQTQADASIAGYTLTDGTSSAVYDPMTVGGMTDWNVGGADHLKSQAFWVRVGGDTREISLSEIYLGSSSSTANSVDASFGVAGVYAIDISYALTHLTIDSAQILESISIQNLSGSSLDLSFFQYNNFDLVANGGGDYVRILDDGSTFSVAQQVEPGVSGLEEATVQNNPGSVFAQVAFYDTILAMLEDGDVDNLSNSTGLIGPGDVEFAFQWDYAIAAGQTETISKIKTLDVAFVPEPASALLAIFGFGAIMISRRRRS